MIRIRATLWFPLLLVLAAMLGAGTPVRAKDDRVALDEFFRGRIAALDGKDVTIRYDFKDRDQLEDWRPGLFFRIEKSQDSRFSWLDGKLELVGTVAVRHVAAWKGDVSVRARIVVDADQDLGGALVPFPESEEFATFTLVERYFHGWDGSDGGTHSIIKFGKQWRERGSTSDYLGFRYVSRKPPDVPLVPGRAMEIAFGIERRKLFFDAGPTELDGKDLGTRLDEVQPAFYAIEGRMLVDDVVITGRLDTNWLKERGIDLRLAKPLPPDGLDADTLALIEGYPDDGTQPSALLEVVADTARPEPARKAAAAALGAGPRAVVTRLIDLLYSGDETTRELGIDIVKSLLGSTYGYRASASAKSRSAAIRKLNEDLKDHPEKLRDDD